MADDPSQLDELKAKHGRNKHCLAAAELELAEIDRLRERLEIRHSQVERERDAWKREVQNSEFAVMRRVNAETDSPLDPEVAEAVTERCRKLLSPTNTSQFLNQP